MPTHCRADLAGLLALLAFGAPGARAENLVCQTIGNKTECRRGDGPLACHGDDRGVSCSGGAPTQAQTQVPRLPSMDGLLDLGDDASDLPSGGHVEVPGIKIDGAGVHIDLR